MPALAVIHATHPNRKRIKVVLVSLSIREVVSLSTACAGCVKLKTFKIGIVIAPSPRALIQK
jgi:hypothetical protein